MANFDEKPAMDQDIRFVFVDWDGKEQPLKAPPFLLDRDALKKEKDANKLVALFLPMMFESGWDGDVARVSYHVDRLRYLTRKGEAVLDQVQPEMTEGGLVQNKYSFPGGQAQVRIVALIDQGKTPKDSKGVRLEILKRGKKPVVIQPMADLCVPAVSPNGELMAVRCFAPGKKKLEGNRIIIINKKGEVVANLQVPH